MCDKHQTDDVAGATSAAAPAATMAAGPEDFGGTEYEEAVQAAPTDVTGIPSEGAPAKLIDFEGPKHGPAASEYVGHALNKAINDLCTKHRMDADDIVKVVASAVSGLTRDIVVTTKQAPEGQPVGLDIDDIRMLSSLRTGLIEEIKKFHAWEMNMLRAGDSPITLVSP